MDYQIIRRSQFKDEAGELQEPQKLGVFACEPGVEISDVQSHFRSGDFLVKPAGSKPKRTAK